MAVKVSCTIHEALFYKYTQSVSNWFNFCRSKKQGLGTSRSGSVDRGGGMQPYLGSGGFMPSQPFATDPSMPLPTPPNTTVQLEEAKRRLEERSVPTPVKSR